MSIGGLQTSRFGGRREHEPFSVGFDWPQTTGRVFILSKDACTAHEKQSGRHYFVKCCNFTILMY